MDRINENLYLGSFLEAKPLELEQHKITAILNVCEWEGRSLEKVYAHIPLREGDCSSDHFYEAVETLKKLLEDGHTVFVHCVAGINRSPAIVATYLAEENRISLEAAIDFVKRSRPDIDIMSDMLALAYDYLDKKRIL